MVYLWTEKGIRLSCFGMILSHHFGLDVQNCRVWVDFDVNPEAIEGLMGDIGDI